MTDDRNDETRRDEAALAPYFAAARQAPPEPPLALLSAILADAGAVGAAPAPVPAPARHPARRWGGASALAASALLGFWVGLSGSFSLDGTTLQAGTAGDDSVLALLDLDAEE